MSDPSETAVKTLFAHSRNLCFFGPDDGGLACDESPGACEARLTDPKWKRVNARIAHIKGEHKGSARYDAAQPDPERQGYDNLMLLCPNHHTMIDDLRPDDFPVERLAAMRAAHLAASAGTAWCSDEQASAYAKDAILISGFSLTAIPVPVEGARTATAGAHIEIQASSGGSFGSAPAPSVSLDPNEDEVRRWNDWRTTTGRGTYSPW